MKLRYILGLVIILGSLIICYKLIKTDIRKDTSQSSTLKQLLILFRHGERAPVFSYPSDPHDDYKWPGGRGALLMKGKRSLYELGKRLRRRYNSFLNVYYLSDEVSVKSSYDDRCQMSAMSLLAGLYPPSGYQIWNQDLLWQPIPVNPIQKEIDNVIAALVNCPNFNKQKEISDKKIIDSLSLSERKLFSYLTNHTGMTVDKIGQIQLLYSTLVSENENGLSLPKWTKEVFPEPMRTIAALNLASFTWTEELKIFRGGPLLKEWLNKLKTNEDEISLYSGHDLTLVTTLRTLGFPVTQLYPDYGATFIIEQYKYTKRSGSYIKAFYYNSSYTEEPSELQLPNCGIECPLSVFEANMEKYIPLNWYKQCNEEGNL